MGKIGLYSLLILFFLTSACVFDSKEAYIHSITYPQGEAIFSEGDRIMFFSEGNARDILWHSSLSGIIGRGNSIDAVLSPGVHTISILSGDFLLDFLEVRVLPAVMVEGNERNYVIFNEEQSLFFPRGSYAPVIFSTGDREAAFSIPRSVEKSGGFNSGKDLAPVSKNCFLTVPRDIPFSVPPGAVKRGNFSGSTEKGIVSDFIFYSEGDTRAFRVVDPGKGTGTEGFEINATLIKQGGGLSLWLEDSVSVDQALVGAMWNGLSTIIKPRLDLLWKPPGDINSDSTVSILMTRVLNDSGKAIGFFNPSDFFPYDDNISSPDYNPTSNMMELLYVGIPETDNFSYSEGSLLATIAHEYQHLTYFYEKTCKEIEKGNPSPPFEELFLSEGLAHLAESLCGYGVSGGNIGFAAKYLENTGYYPLSGPDVYGREDNIGQRGGMSLFLYWLFEKMGGAEWSDSRPGGIVDNGGIAFLRKLQTSQTVGWEAVSYAAGGIPAVTLLKEWARSVNAYKPVIGSNPEMVRDPFTGQLISIHPFAGEVEVHDSLIFHLKGPAREDFSESRNILPHSIVFGKNIELQQAQEVNVQSTEGASLYISFLLKN